MNITRKVKLYIINENKELIKEQYKFIRDSIYAQYQALNIATSYMGGLYLEYKDFKNEEYINRKNSFKYNKSNPKFEGINFGKGVDTIALLYQKVNSSLAKTPLKEIARGERVLPTYKRTYPLMTKGKALQFSYAENNLDVIIKWVNGIRFKCDLGYHKNSLELQHTLHKVISGEYKVSQSSICFNKRNELILNLCLNIPEIKKEYIEGRTLGVDVGLAIPAYTSVSDSPYIRQGFGCYDEFARVRQQFKKRKQRLYKQRELAKGGKGRNKKLHSLDFLAKKEGDFAKTYNHQLSRKIVDFAVKNQCQYINVEKINSDTLDDKLLGQWGYYQLQEQIKYKAELLGLEVRFINPAYTSQTCSCCGNIDENNRPKKERGQAYFQCTNKDCKLSKRPVNADWNASVNIANSKNYIK